MYDACLQKYNYMCFQTHVEKSVHEHKHKKYRTVLKASLLFFLLCIAVRPSVCDATHTRAIAPKTLYIEMPNLIHNLTYLLKL